MASVMRRRLMLAVFFLASLGLGMPQAQGAVIAEDEFDYANGALSGNNGGTGWTSAWQGTGPATVSNNTLLLSFTPSGQDRPEAAYRTFTETTSGSQFDTVFFRFTLDFSSSNFSSEEFFSMWVDNGIPNGTHLDGIPNFGVRLDQGPDGQDYFVRFTSGTTNGSEWDDTPQLVSGQSVMLVAELSRDPGGSYDTLKLWINPSGVGDYATPDASVQYFGSDLTTLSRLGFHTNKLKNGHDDTFYVDDLIIATTFAEAIVPEPASFVAWSLLGGLGLCAAWRHRRKSKA